MGANSAGAALFQMWTRMLRDELGRAEGPRPFPGSAARARFEGLIGRADSRALARILAGGTRWCAATGRRSCREIALAALARARWQLFKLTGRHAPAAWRWGAVHRADYAHIPFSRMKPLERLFDRRIANGGSPDSISAASARFIEAEGFIQDFGPGFRQVIALGPRKTEHWYMNSTGQSGSVFSRHYDDMIVPFHRNLLYRLPPAARQP